MSSLRVQVYYGTWMNCSEVIKSSYFGPFHQAVLSAKYEELKRLARRGLDVNQSSLGWTALHLAAELGDPKATALLLQFGADPRIRCRHPEVLENFRGPGVTALMFALKSGCCRTARLLMESAKQTNDYIIGRRKFTYLHSAAYLNDAQMALTLLEGGAEVDVEDSAEQTALYVAAEHGHTEVARLLLEHGADPQRANGFLGSALLASVRSGHMPTFRLLLQHVPHPNDQDMAGENALHIALRLSRGHMAQELIRAGSDLEATTVLRKTALHYAVQCQDLPALVALLDQGVNLACLDFRARSPLHLAMKLPDPRFYCYAFGEENEAAEAAEEASICLSLRRQQVILAELLARGASVHQRNVYGRTALDSAVVSSSVDDGPRKLGQRILENCIEPLLLAGSAHPKLYNEEKPSAYRQAHVLELFAKYFVKRRAAGFRLDENARAFLKLHEAEGYEKRCAKELRRIKSKRLGRKTTLYKFLRTTSKRELASCARCPFFEKAFDSERIDRDYPIYKHFLQLNYVIAKKQEMHDSATDAFYKINDFALPSLVVDMILNYLTDGDKKKLIQAAL